MAFCIQVIKSDENDKFVFYKYKDTADESYGLIKLNKKTGDVFEEILSKQDPHGSKAQRAGWAILKSWTKGEIPCETWWES